MLNIQRISNTRDNYFVNSHNGNNSTVSNPVLTYNQNNEDIKKVNAENLKAYHPSFASLLNVNKKDDNKIQTTVDVKTQFDTVKSKLDKDSIKMLESLKQKGILENNNSNDGSTVLDNLYKIATEPRIQGLNDKLILAEVIKALDNPFSITQKFGDIPTEVAMEISQETGEVIPEAAKNVVSSSCVAASMEFNLAYRKPAEFARFAAGLSGENYMVNKKIKTSCLSDNLAEVLWKLKEFNTKYKLEEKGKYADIQLSPDRNAIVRARVQTSYKDKGERSCVDVLIQSAILNFASQNTYNAITDERTGKYNPDKTGLTDFEKNFAEQVIFETPKLSVIYQNLDENGVLQGYNSTLDETKQHILKSLEMGQNVIIGYTYTNENKKVEGGHEITIIGYEKDAAGQGKFICNDTDDGLDNFIKIEEEKLLPLIHHAGISKEALNKEDVVVEPWREYISEFQTLIKQEQINQ